MSHWDYREVRDRIELAFRRAKDKWNYLDRDADWYGEQLDWIRKLAKKYNVNPTKVAAIVAVLSPQVTWQNQLKYTPIIIDELSRSYDVEQLTYPGFLLNKRKAWVIWNHTDYSMVSGPKVYAFWRNLMGDLNEVTIDTHMFDIACGVRYPEERKAKGRRNKKRANVIADAVKSISSEGGYFPAEIQAIVWAHHRRNISRNINK